MNRFRLTFVFFGLLWSLLSSGTALAAPPPGTPTWATWQFDTSFVKGQVQATWTVIVGGEDSAGLPVELVSATRPIGCLVDGAVAIGSNSADFNGGAINCSLPDFALAANALIAQHWGPGYELALSDLCECLPSQERRVEATVAPTGTGSNPIFSHPNLLFGAPGEGGHFANYLAAAGQDSSSRFDKVAGLTSLRSDHLCDPLDGCKFVHYRAGNVIDVEYLGFVNAAVYTGKTTVTIGANPHSGEKFYGQMESLHVDPGCRMD